MSSMQGGPRRGSGRRLKRSFVRVRRELRSLFRECARLGRKARHKKKVLLIGYRVLYPTWEDEKIIKLVGCDSSYPAKIPQYAAIVALFKAERLELHRRKANGNSPDS